MVTHLKPQAGTYAAYHIDEEDAGAGTDDGPNEGTDSPARPIHNISYVPNDMIPQRRRGQAPFLNGGRVKIALCSSWMKQRSVLSLFLPVYRVVFSFRICPTRIV